MALNLKDVMVRETEYDSLVIYNILVFSLLSAGNKILARRILNEMEAKGLVFNDSELLDMNGKPSMKTWSVLIQSLCQQGRTAEAEELLHGMVAASEVPGKELYMCVIDRYHAENNVSKSTEVMRMMQESGHKPDFESHWSVISNLSSCVMKENKKSGEGFLSGLLSGSGYQVRKDLKIKSS
ncbi:Pentatricopeptide repeat-containing protein At5g15280, mitochondrial [Linum perenne]